MVYYDSPDDYLFNLETTNTGEAKRLWRESIKERWDHKCAYCGSEDNITLDHIQPRSQGGTDSIHNVICACFVCNQDKGHNLWSEWYLNQFFFTEERTQKIIDWMTPPKKGRYLYRPRRNIAYG